MSSRSGTEMSHHAIVHGFIFIFGLCVGSFANVCVHRIPSAMSLLFPGSRCPHCEAAIRFYDNIPLISFLLLGGRCRRCGSAISVRYPMIELLSGGLAISLFMKYGLTVEWLTSYTFTMSLLIVTFIDIDHRIIPDIITLPGIGCFLLLSFITHHITWLDSVIGAVSGGGSLLLVAMTYNLFTKKEGMGGGDIKLLAMVGAFVGWKGVLFTIFMASVAGTLVGVIMMLKTRSGLKMALPFGPFLSIGAIAYIHFGNRIIQWYIR